MKHSLAIIIPTLGLILLGCAGVLVHKPEVETLTASPNPLSGLDDVEFRALVSDPEGASDILIGTLVDSESGAIYGTFERDGAEWSLTLSADELADVVPFDFDVDEERIFEATFLDQAGHESKPATVAVTLHCNGSPTCEGRCADHQNDPANCGTCGNTCSKYTLYGSEGGERQDPTCVEGHCVVTSDCTQEQAPRCKKLCIDQGFVGCPEGIGPVGLKYDADSCNGDPRYAATIDFCGEDMSDFNRDWMSCLCLE